MKIPAIIIALLLFAKASLCQNINEKLYQAVITKDSLTVKDLLNKNADANFKKQLGFFKISLLISAVIDDDLNIVKALVENGAEVDWRDAFKTTALMYAAHKGNKEILLYLIKHGADVKAKDDQGNSVLSAAEGSKNNEVIEIIKELLNRK